MTINQIATMGCEIMTDNGKIVAWSVDREWGEKIIKAIELAEKEDNEFIRNTSRIM